MRCPHAIRDCERLDRCQCVSGTHTCICKLRALFEITAQWLWAETICRPSSSYPGQVFTCAIFTEKQKAPSANTTVQPSLNKSSPSEGKDILVKELLQHQQTWLQAGCRPLSLNICVRNMILELWTWALHEIFPPWAISSQRSVLKHLVNVENEGGMTWSWRKSQTGGCL